MTYKDYIAQLDSLKQNAENRIIAVIPDFETYAYHALNEWIDESLEIKNGSLVASEETIAILNKFDMSFLKVLNQMEKYNGAVSSLVKTLPKINTLIQGFQKTAIDVSANENLVVNEILKAYTDNGLNTEFIQPLRDQLYQNIAAGTNVRQAKSGLEDYIKSSDKPSKLNRYLTQTSQQAVDSYSGMVNKKLMDAFNYPYLIMSGSLIKTSSPQCRMAINEFGGLISVPEWEDILKPIALTNGLIDGTTFKNLPFNRLHWGCRHEFTPSMTKPN